MGFIKVRIGAAISMSIVVKLQYCKIIPLLINVVITTDRDKAPARLPLNQISFWAIKNVHYHVRSAKSIHKRCMPHLRRKYIQAIVGQVICHGACRRGK